jgi:hypothetical protein
MLKENYLSKINNRISDICGYIGTLLLLISVFSTAVINVEASNPSSATLAPTATAPVTWNGTATGGAADGEGTCIQGINCDSFTITLSGTPADWVNKVARVRVSWLLLANDYDVYIHKDTVTGPIVASSASGTTIEEEADIDPAVVGTGTFVVNVVYFAATAADQYKASATVTNVTSTPTVIAKGPAPSFFNYLSPQGIGNDAGEPTIGVNWSTGNVMFIAILETLRVTFDDSTSPARATWTNVSAPNTSIDSFDPILFTDSDVSTARTNRTFVSQLLPSKASLMAFTDNDGETWTPSQGSGINSGVDHQTVGGGPYAKNGDGTLKGGAIQRPGLDGKIYPHAVYYASQDIGLAQIARSDDGGLTFGPAIPMWNLTQCNGLHGHIKVAPDGTIYVPNPNCAGKQGLAVSEDNGLTWEIRTIPGSTDSGSDPSIGIGSNGTVYYGFADNGDSTPKVAVSNDKGRTWRYMRNVGSSLGIQNVSFPAVVAGDDNRAAMFFLGSTTGGAAGVGQDLGGFDGTWYGYIAMTYDGGNSWVTVNATPNDPVQRGPVCGQGTLCASGTRKLLDFNDVTIDAQGRVVAAYADGCITQQCIQGVDRSGPNGTPDGRVDGHDNDKEDKAAIIRQSGGTKLLAAPKKTRK